MIQLEAQGLGTVPLDSPNLSKVYRHPKRLYFGLSGGHGEVRFKDVRVPKENILLGPGRGFEIAQGRLGPGRIHHCMRLIGYSERALALMKTRVSPPVPTLTQTHCCWLRNSKHWSPLRTELTGQCPCLESASLFCMYFTWLQLASRVGWAPLCLGGQKPRPGFMVAESEVLNPRGLWQPGTICVPSTFRG